jgi:ComF family protein
VPALFKSFFNLLYPALCEACGGALVAGERVVCTACRYNLPKTNQWLQQGNPVEQIFWGRVPLESACSFFYFIKGSKYQKVLHKLKYKNKPHIGVELGRYFGVELKKSPVYREVEFVIPIPLHTKRMRERGYNQSERVAVGIAESMGIQTLPAAVFRQVYTQTQTKKTREERLKNVEAIFAATPELQQVKNKHILLVDDVLTTGATIEACALTILENVECKISVATLAVAR